MTNVSVSAVLTVELTTVTEGMAATAGDSYTPTTATGKAVVDSAAAASAVALESFTLHSRHRYFMTMAVVEHMTHSTQIENFKYGSIILLEVETIVVAVNLLALLVCPLLLVEEELYLLRQWWKVHLSL